jgi:hypothetical protein
MFEDMQEYVRPYTDDEIGCYPLSDASAQLFEQGGWWDRVKRKVKRVGAALATGGASEAVRAAKSKKGRRILGAIATGGASLALTKKGRRGLAAIMSGGASELLRNKTTRRLVAAAMSGGGSELVRNKKIRQAFITGGLSAIPKSVRRAVLSGGGSGLVDVLASKRQRKAFAQASYNLLRDKRLPRKGVERRKLASTVKYSMPPAAQDALLGEMKKWLPNLMRMSTDMKRMVHDGVINVLRRDWAVETGQPSHSPGVMFLAEDTARRLSATPPTSRDERGNPSWHTDDIENAAKTAISSPVSNSAKAAVEAIAHEVAKSIPKVPIGDDKASASPSVTDQLKSSIADIVKGLMPSTPVSKPTIGFDPIVVVPQPVELSIMNAVTGWRRDVLGILEKVSPFAGLPYAVASPWAVFGNVMTESGGNKNAVNKEDGYYKDWKRQVASVGLFQMREPTAYWVRKSKKRIGQVNALNLPALPTNPQNNKTAVVAALKQYPDQIYLAMVLYAIIAQWMRELFPVQADGRLGPATNSADDIVVSYANSKHTAAHPAWCVAVRLFWAGSSKAGPRALLKKGVHKRVVESRFLKYCDSEYQKLTGGSMS